MISLSPTFGGSNPGFRAEVVHSVKKHLNLMCGCSFIAHPSAFASISVSIELPFVDHVNLWKILMYSYTIAKLVPFVHSLSFVHLCFRRIYFSVYQFIFLLFDFLLVIQIGRSKWNGNVGNSGIVVRVDTPLSNIRRTSFSVQINTGIEC